MAAASSDVLARPHGLAVLIFDEPWNLSSVSQNTRAGLSEDEAHDSTGRTGGEKDAVEVEQNAKEFMTCSPGGSCPFHAHGIAA